MQDAAFKDLVVHPHLICPINKTLFVEPVLLKDGRAYEKSAIERVWNEESKQFNEQVGEEVISLEALQSDIRIPDLQLKAAAEEFLKLNPWAFEYEEGRGYKETVEFEY